MTVLCIVVVALSIAFDALVLLCCSITKENWKYEGKCQGFALGYEQRRKDEQLDHEDDGK